MRGYGQEEEAGHEPGQAGCGGEAAGQAAANCAAVCCCCPMALLEVVLLVAVRLPADIMRRVKRRRTRAGERGGGGGKGAASPSGSTKAMIATESVSVTTRVEAEAASDLEREIMASRLYGAGFWRSVSSGSSSCASSVRRP